MEERKRPPVKEPDPDPLDEFTDLDVEMLIPTMNVGKELAEPLVEKECIIKDDKILGLYDEILDNCRKDRTQCNEVLQNFLEMVMNEGDPSAASKEAVVNILKVQSDISDKMAKVADLMTRIKLKDSNTFPRYLAAQQNNKVVIEGDQRSLIKSMTKMVKEKKNAK